MFQPVVIQCNEAIFQMISEIDKAHTPHFKIVRYEKIKVDDTQGYVMEVHNSIPGMMAALQHKMQTHFNRVRSLNGLLKQNIEEPTIGSTEAPETKNPD